MDIAMVEMMTDAARDQHYMDIERERVSRLHPVGTHVAYSSVGKPGVDAGLGEYGIVIDKTSNGALSRVEWDNSEPEWIATELLIPA